MKYWQMEILKGRLKELGSYITNTTKDSSRTTYSYLEAEDGRVFRDVEVGQSLDSKLRLALERNDAVEIFLFTLNDPKAKTKVCGICAIRTSDGRIFGQEMPKSVYKGLRWCLYIGGLFALPYLGMGLLLWWWAWRLGKNDAMVAELHDYVTTLPDVVLLR